VVEEAAANRGYTEPGREGLAYTLGDETPGDLFEAMTFGREDAAGPRFEGLGHHFHPNVWPARPEGMRDAFLAYEAALRAVADDVLKRPFIFMGMLAFTILAILAATSTNGMIRRLGRRWQRIHRLVYVAAVAGVIHFTWGQKADIREPLEWAAYLMLLLGLRLVFSWRKRRNTLRRSVAPPARSVGGIAR
jgi:hypothetical protein